MHENLQKKTFELQIAIVFHGMMQKEGTICKKKSVIIIKLP